MARTGPGFVVGVLIGGLSGFAAGYLFSRDGHSDVDRSIGSIDLTPTIELKKHAPVVESAATEEDEEKPA